MREDVWRQTTVGEMLYGSGRKNRQADGLRSAVLPPADEESARESQSHHRSVVGNNDLSNAVAGGSRNRHRNVTPLALLYYNRAD